MCSVVIVVFVNIALNDVGWCTLQIVGYLIIFNQNVNIDHNLNYAALKCMSLFSTSGVYFTPSAVDTNVPSTEQMFANKARERSLAAF